MTTNNEQDLIRLAATVRPGDTLVVSFDRNLTDQEAHEMIEHWWELAPGVSIFIMPYGVTDMKVISE